jgi:TolB protein
MGITPNLPVLCQHSEYIVKLHAPGVFRMETEMDNRRLQSADRKVPVLLALFFLLGIVLLIAGCGGNLRSNTAPASTSSLVFASTRALDGSDAANINNDSNIWRVNADGSGTTPLTRLTAASQSTGAPIWSPDGSKIAYISARALDGSNATNIFGGPNIWVMNADGSGAMPVTKFTFDLCAVFGGLPVCLTPLQYQARSLFSSQASPLIWSPDGSKLAFLSSQALDGSNSLLPGSPLPGAVNIWIVNADGTGATPVTKMPFGDLTLAFPTWSPDGGKIAFLSGGNFWVVNTNGTGLTPLTKLTLRTNAAAYGGPVWSPDSTKLVYASAQAFDGSDAVNPTFTVNIWMANADGSGATPLTKLTANAGNSLLHCITPAWSPDGSKIAFVSQRAFDGSDATNGAGADNVWVINADGSNPTPVTRLLHASMSSPAWSPDSRKLAFTSPRLLDGSDGSNGGNNPNNNVSNIWIINADGSGATPLTRLTAPAAQNFFPRWRPQAQGSGAVARFEPATP